MGLFRPSTRGGVDDLFEQHLLFGHSGREVFHDYRLLFVAVGDVESSAGP